MIVHSDTMSIPSSVEIVQRLYDKNVELEKRRRRSTQARVPSDPNTWQQMRENYETIILENHAFSEQHNIEYALWQLHYRRIEDFRAHLSAAASSASQTGKGSTKHNRVTKIRLQFKGFLSEATGFYHDLIVKIRAKTGLPIGHFPEDSNNRIVMEKDGKRSTEMKEGLISCNRCLIYLGDLARYKGLYGEGESKSGDYAAASSYYLQAASLWPSSGNPHHQLAILATYSGDELVAVYHYFRSLAAESPFSTAKDNLIVAFEKNRKSYSQLHGDAKGSAIKESPEKATKTHEAYKAFSIRFVHLNGILFTRTSLETFGEVLSLVSGALHELLFSGPEEELNFVTDAGDDGLVIIRIISILVFTVHNVKREAEGQSYADILQHKVLLQNALTAAFELMGCILKRCVQFSDPSSSYLLSGILVFLEYLASRPDLSEGSDLDDKQANIIINFWNHCMCFLNKLLYCGLIFIENEDEVCFFNMGRYKEGGTENRLALKEDFELRGFLPLQPAQSILDFSRRHSFAGDKEKRARVERILAAGKALVNVVKVDKKPLSFDSKLKKFVIGTKPQKLGSPKTSGGIGENFAYSTTNTQQKSRPCLEGEDEEDEEIIFKPTVLERRTDDTAASKWTPNEGLEPDHNAFADGFKSYADTPVSYSPGNNIHQQATALYAGSQPTLNFVQQHPQLYHSHPSMRLVDPQASLDNGLKSLSLLVNSHVMKPLMQDDKEISQSATLSRPIEQTVNATIRNISYGQSKASGATTQPKINPGTSSSKGPVNRPVRRLGPPPGFGSARPKQITEGNFGSSDLKGSFPFPGKQGLATQFEAEKLKGWQDHQILQSLISHPEQMQQYKGQQQQQYQYQGQSTWTGRNPV
ncbi:hypothetical protein LguiA_012873 [Lonicera macranthoides]